MTMPKRVLIVGGVAGGATCAARLRRLDETAEIVVFERGPYVSFANCGLPYYVGDVIRHESKLLLASADLFKKRFDIDVRTGHEVTAIDRERCTVTVKNVATGEMQKERYDALLLSPGASAITPAVPGVDLPGIFTVRTIPDSRRVRDFIAERTAKTAVVVGAGFIGLEMAENLVRRGLGVTIVEKAGQVLPPLDFEMAAFVQKRLDDQGVALRLSEGVSGFAAAGDGKIVTTTEKGDSLVSDLVILSIGIRPETGLAAESGIAIGKSGGIVVDDSMRTSDPRIFAVGDAVETTDVVTGATKLVPLAGPANRQGRVAADAIAGRATRFRGAQATAVCGVMGLTVASTGASEKALLRAGIVDFEKVYIHPGHHVGYYPGAKPIHMKVLFRKSDGRILGAQAIGEEGVEKRIDVIAMAIQLGGSMHDLAEAELCYAPQYGAAKDPVNLAGFVGENARNGDMPLSRLEDLGEEGAFVLDVRDPGECAQGMVPGAVNIPLADLRGRLGDLPKDKPIHVMCAVGQRGYYAVRLLRQHGLDARNFSGGFRTYEVAR
jgi:NADPH-dependent 2,4-dienoyl-CoA reductase/sulfur reductase-like enzyme/rhodanese-related sulfurtransferase